MIGGPTTTTEGSTLVAGDTFVAGVTFVVVGVTRVPTTGRVATIGRLAIGRATACLRGFAGRLLLVAALALGALALRFFAISPSRGTSGFCRRCHSCEDRERRKLSTAIAAGPQSHSALALSFDSFSVM